MEIFHQPVAVYPVGAANHVHKPTHARGCRGDVGFLDATDPVDGLVVPGGNLGTFRQQFLNALNLGQPQTSIDDPGILGVSFLPSVACRAAYTSVL
jgi:hypothetical protein